MAGTLARIFQSLEVFCQNLENFQKKFGNFLVSPLGTIWSYFVPKAQVPKSTYVVTRIFFHFHLLQKGHFSKIHISAPGGLGSKFFWAFNQVWIGVQNACLK